MLLTRGNHLEHPRKRDRPTQVYIPCVSSFVHKNLNPGHPREEIVERVTHHADLILPWTWNQVERGDLGWER